ncbi:hypothetical protein BA950_09600 [Erythrobacter sp. SAORIC-644]|uniref:hypothetical protein n=1 Tax=Erythrobacter sp. SAORIC-644 TaxID=1869314 RepID=UPI000C9EDFB9|nr:hypothetical protein [Erythrobacter sp. SAORIC-644]PNQ76055.1 hypothetical protein BA950_09600 [Erythrobacter sp. SAORIC-644]
MNGDLAQRIGASLDRPVRDEVAAYAKRLGEEAGALAVLFYGSNLRTGSLEGVLDFYILLPGPQRERIWPRVSYREWDHAGERLRAKIATMSLRQFASAAKGLSRDTTIWARFVQPSALVWQANEEARAEVTQALCDAAVTAGRLAAAVGPARGTADDYWRALFRATYKAEFRVEKPGRENSILEVNADHFDGLLPLAWNAGGMRFKRMNGLFEPLPNSAERRRVLKWWSRRARLGKPLNLLRLAKATTTFDGAADYAAWKLQRHTGIALEVTPFRARHPLLAAPGALVELWRKRRA